MQNKRMKFFITGLIVTVLLTIMPQGNQVSAAPTATADIMEVAREGGQSFSEFYRPKGGIVIDSENGHVLWSENPDKVWPIASLSKLMTAYLILEDVAQGKYARDNEFEVSSDIEKIAQIYALSNNKMVTGVPYTIDDLMTLMLIPSSNAATIMLSDISSPGNRGAFIDRMNDTAKTLGMTNTRYFNASGATATSFNGLYQPEGYDPNGDNVSTPRDIAILIYHFMNKYPEILDYTKAPKVTVKANTPFEETFESYVLSLEGNKYSYEGTDGLKTGSSPSAAFGYGATIKRDNLRLIQVLLGVGTWDEQNGEDIRFPIGNALLDKLFAEYSYKNVLAQGTHEINDRELVLEKDLYGLVKKESEFSFDISEDGIRLNNGLESVSPKIKSVAAPFKANKKGLFDFSSSDGNTPPKSFATANKFVPLLMGLTGLCSIVASRLVIRRRHRYNKHGNLLTTAGILVGAVLVIIAFILTIEQLLSSLF